MFMAKITPEIVRDVRGRYAVGQSQSAIASELNISSTVVTKAINDESYGLGKLDVPEAQVALFAETKIENDRIYQAKEKMMDFVDAAIAEGMESQTKMLYINSIISAMTTLDRIARLNKGEATDRAEVITKHVDYAEVLKELKNPEDQFAFLKAQLTTRREEEKQAIIDIK